MGLGTAAVQKWRLSIAEGRAGWEKSPSGLKGCQPVGLLATLEGKEHRWYSLVPSATHCICSFGVSVAPWTTSRVFNEELTVCLVG